MLPPKTWPIAWWPRHTPSTGMPRSANARIAAQMMPASSGRPGPGRQQHRVGRRASASSTVSSSLRTHLWLGAELAEVLHEVVDEAVVAVDHENARVRRIAADSVDSPPVAPPRERPRSRVTPKGTRPGEAPHSARTVAHARPAASAPRPATRRRSPRGDREPALGADPDGRAHRPRGADDHPPLPRVAGQQHAGAVGLVFLLGGLYTATSGIDAARTDLVRLVRRWPAMTKEYIAVT